MLWLCKTNWHSLSRISVRSVCSLLFLLASCEIDAKESGPLKVFVLVGQSNMQGHAQVKTLDAMRLNPSVAPLLDDLIDGDGKPKTLQQVWISSIGSAEEIRQGALTTGFGAADRRPKIGPEYSFGIYMHQMLDEPFVIIKAAWGGKSLHTDFRPPSAGPYEFNQEQLDAFSKQQRDLDKMRSEKDAATGRNYRLMIEHVKSILDSLPNDCPLYETKLGYELAGMVWFQGWNDMVDRGTYPNRDQPGGYDQYGELLSVFISDVRRDLDSPKLPVVIGVLGVGGPTAEYGPSQQRYKVMHESFRQAMASPAKRAEFTGTVVPVYTEEYWDREMVRLRQIEERIRPSREEIEAQKKAGTITEQESRDKIESLYQSSFDPTELTYLRESVSNGDYHYMGSAAIIAPIGKAFAEAMYAMIGE